ncbi:DUF6338 family protein [Patulibacter brassicae]|jgi:hypothetical protein|uniref:DUF6338 family protein n=1 Tax=Patulibacter brassicae TaxID=1705717 RepID=A0ABU4VQT8_9ACTN|nr:DUF6338 family protein [Patulibacter brassicae]MDX8153301.1 DUF6338 family protein [Patulibacter brassicae]
MVPQTGTALLVLFAFVMPGFVATLMRDRLFLTRSVTGDLERILVALAYSATIYGVAAAALAITAPLTSFGTDDITTAWRGQSPFAVYVAAAGYVLLLAPLVIAGASFRWHNSTTRGQVLKRLDVDPAHNTRSAWDHWFQRRERALIIVTLVDGEKTAGLFDANSMAGYTRDGQDLYLEKRWTLNEHGWFDQAVEQGYGVWIPANQIARIELYRPTEDDDEPEPRAEGQHAEAPVENHDERS